MLLLLKAECRKLARPLVWGTGLAVVGFCLLLTWVAADNARGALSSPKIPDICSHSATPQCQSLVAHAHAAARAAAIATSSLAQPGQIGHLAAGMLASLPGLLLIALVAGGHWGGEWGLRTIRQVLSREGRRGRVLAAKWLTIWATGVATMLCCWVALLAAAPAIAAATGLPSAGASAWAGIGSSMGSLAHAAVVLGLFAAIATAAGTIARGQLATTAITAGVMLLALLLASIASVGWLSPASFVQAWMHFPNSGYLPTSFWSKFMGPGTHLRELTGLIGIAVTAAAAAAIARWRMAADVTV